VVQGIAVWRSVLQGIAVWCSVAQFGAVCCSVAQCGAVNCSVAQCGAGNCSVAHGGIHTVCNTVLQCVATSSSTLHPYKRVSFCNMLQYVAVHL